MHTNRSRLILQSIAVAAAVASAQGCTAATVSNAARPPHISQLYGGYSWQPIHIGAGGFVTGFVVDLKDATVRWCRTDVGNAYRWDDKTGQWMPMIVRLGNIGLPYAITRAPESGGVESVNVDPSNPKVVYLAYTGAYSPDLNGVYPTPPGDIYKSTDGGANFTISGDLNVAMNANGNYRNNGERIQVDPFNGSDVFFGSEQNGIWRSTNGGVHWVQVTAGGAPAATSNIQSVQFGKAGAVTDAGVRVGKLIYATVLNGSVYKSMDGGQIWTVISSGTSLDGNALRSCTDSNGALYVIQNNSSLIWKYSSNKWTSITTPFSATGICVDPDNAARIWAISPGGTVSVSTNSGTSWTSWNSNLGFANTFSWLPQPPAWRSNGGIYMDSSGVLWIPEGNEGVLTYKPTGSEGAGYNALWTIDSAGIEEFVTQDAVDPPGGNPLVAVEDASGLVVNDPATFSAKQFDLQNQLISCGTGLGYCPNSPSYAVCATADLFHTGSGDNYSGYTTDGGQTWTRFATYPTIPETGVVINQPGSIAVSVRGSWGAGSDHLVWLPSGNYPPYYSTDGGATWHRNTTFPVNASNGQIGSGFQAFWIFALKQRELAADPFVANKFYLELVQGGFWVSTDGGVTWAQEANNGLPNYTHNGQLATNKNVRNDLWFCDGVGGATEHGLWHSKDGGASFTKIAGIDYAYSLCNGAGRGLTGDAKYTVYFYGQITGNDNWGVFRSTNGGKTWQQISLFPTGLVDMPTCMTASWDTFSTVFVGFSGNSFVYGTAMK